MQTLIKIRSIIIFLLIVLTTTIVCADDSEAPTWNKPAVVKINVKAEINGIVPELNFDQEQLAHLNVRLSGNRAAIAVELIKNMSDYAIPGRDRNFETAIGATGSGFIADSQGYVVTNAHVVTISINELTDELNKLLAVDIRNFAALLGIDPPVELQRAFASAALQFYEKNSSLKINKKIFVLMGINDGDGKIDVKRFEGKEIKVGEPIPGKDVAILKINGDNLPTLPIGDDTALNIGNRIFIIGFPGAATTHPVIDKESQIEPTLTSGLVSARKKVRNQDWTVLQTDAAITHGSSGGPAINKEGEVVGIATFGTIDPHTGQELAGLNFIVPITIVIEFLSNLQTSTVNTTPTNEPTQDTSGSGDNSQGDYKSGGLSSLIILIFGAGILLLPITIVLLVRRR